MERGCSDTFDHYCNLYTHYLDTVLDGLEVIKVGEENQDKGDYISIFHSSGGIYSDGIITPDTCAYTSLENDLFLPRGIYNIDKGVSIIFDSGCTHAVTPFENYFVGKVKPVGKLMNGLGVTADIVGEETVLWQFYDEFGVIKRVKVPAYLVSASKVGLFSPQSYFRQEGCGECQRKYIHLC